MNEIGVQYLCAAIVKRTIEDYANDEVEIHRELKKKNPDQKLIKIKRDDQKQIIRDIRSGGLDLYTDLDPEVIIGACKKYANKRVNKEPIHMEMCGKNRKDY